jgi:hypothetical protein
MERAGGDAINQGSGGEAADVRLDLGDRLSARHRNFPGTHRLAGTLALARRISEFGAGRVSLLGMLQRRWSRDFGPAGGFAPIYAWPVDFTGRGVLGTSRSVTLHGSGQPELNRPKIAAGTTLSRVADGLHDAGMAMPLGFVPVTSATGCSVSGENTRPRDTTLVPHSTVHQATHPGGAENPISLTDSAVNPKIEAPGATPAPTARNEKTGASPDAVVALSKDTRRTVAPISEGTANPQAQSDESVRQTSVSRAIVRRPIGGPLQREHAGARGESALLMPTEHRPTEPTTVTTPSPAFVGTLPQGVNPPTVAKGREVSRAPSKDTGRTVAPITEEPANPQVQSDESVRQTSVSRAIVTRPIGGPLQTEHAGARGESSLLMPTEHRATVMTPSTAFVGTLPQDLNPPTVAKGSDIPRAVSERVASRSGGQTPLAIGEFPSRLGGPTAQLGPAIIRSVTGIVRRASDVSTQLPGQAPVIGSSVPAVVRVARTLTDSQVNSEDSSQPAATTIATPRSVSVPSAGVRPDVAGRESGPVDVPGALVPTRLEATESGPIQRLGLPSESERKGDPATVDSRRAARVPEEPRPAQGRVKEDRTSAVSAIRGIQLGNAIFKRHTAIPQGNRGVPAGTERPILTGVMKDPNQKKQGIVGNIPLAEKRTQKLGTSLPAQVQRKTELEFSQDAAQAGQLPPVPQGAPHNRDRFAREVPLVRSYVSPTSQLPRRAGALHETSVRFPRVLTGGGNFSLESAVQPTAIQEGTGGTQLLNRLSTSRPGDACGSALPVSIGQVSGISHQIASGLFRRHQTVPITRPVEYRAFRSTSVPNVGFLQPRSMATTPVPIGGSASAELTPRSQRDSLPVIDPESPDFTRDSQSTTIGAVLRHERALSGAEQAQSNSQLHTDGPAQTLALKDVGPLTAIYDSPHGEGTASPGSIADGTDSPPPKIFRATHARREGFMVGTSPSLADFSSRVLQRVSPGRRQPQIQSAGAGLSLSNARQAISADHLQTSDRFRSTNGLTPGAWQASFLTRLAADTPDVPGLSNTAPKVYGEGLTPHAPVPRLRLDPLQSENAVWHSLRSKVALLRSDSNQIINRLPSSDGAPVPPGGLVHAGEPVSSALRHVTTGPRPVQHSVQRQALRGTPSTAGNQTGFQTPALPSVPAPSLQNAGLNMSQLADQVYGLIVRRIASERDRRGL